MATKPDIADARWATDETNNTAPSSGQRDTGWTPNQVAVSDYFNVLYLEAYKWFQYLDDGDLSGNHSIDDDLTISANNDVTISGTGKYKHGERTIRMPGRVGVAAPDTMAVVAPINNLSKSFTPASSSGQITFPIMLPEGARL